MIVCCKGFLQNGFLNNPFKGFLKSPWGYLLRTAFENPLKPTLFSKHRIDDNINTKQLGQN